MHINCASLSLCSSPVVISNKGVSPSGDLTIERVFLYSTNMTFMISVSIPYMIKIYFIFSHVLNQKSIKRRVASRFLEFTPYSIR